MGSCARCGRTWPWDGSRQRNNVCFACGYVPGQPIDPDYRRSQARTQNSDEDLLGCLKFVAFIAGFLVLASVVITILSFVWPLIVAVGLVFIISAVFPGDSNSTTQPSDSTPKQTPKLQSTPNRLTGSPHSRPSTTAEPASTSPKELHWMYYGEQGIDEPDDDPRA